MRAGTGMWSGTTLAPVIQEEWSTCECMLKRIFFFTQLTSLACVLVTAMHVSATLTASNPKECCCCLLVNYLKTFLERTLMLLYLIMSKNNLGSMHARSVVREVCACWSCIFQTAKLAEYCVNVHRKGCRYACLQRPEGLIMTKALIHNLANCKKKMIWRRFPFSSSAE